MTDVKSNLRDAWDRLKMASYATSELVKYEYGRKMKKYDRKGEGGIKTIVGIVVGLFVVATIIPTALTTLANATLTGVDPAVTTVLKVLLPILAVIGIAMIFLRR